MKHYITIVFLFIYTTIKACTCNDVKIGTKIANSDFIATVNIVNIEQDSNNKIYHNADIKIIELFKGNNIKKLRILSDLDSSCAFYTPKNTKWLIYAYLDLNDNYTIGFCSGAKQIYKTFNATKYPNAQKNYNNEINYKLKLLRTLKKENVLYNNKAYRLDYFFHPNCIMKYHISNNYKQQYAIFKLKIDKNLKVKRIKAIKEFDSFRYTKKQLSCLKENISVFSLKEKELKQLPKKTCLIIILRYIPSTENDIPIITDYI